MNNDLQFCENEANHALGAQFNFVAGIVDSCPVIRIQSTSLQNVGHAWYDKKDMSILHCYIIDKMRFLTNS
mgnify:CR=1 FL=1